MEVRLDRFYLHPPARVWSVLTGDVRQWLPARGFRPVRGCVFLVDGPAVGGFDGRASCTVLEVDPPKKLAFSWKGGPADGVVTLELVPEHEGTRVRVVHSGIPGERPSVLAPWDGWLAGLGTALHGQARRAPPWILAGAALGFLVLGTASIGTILVWPRWQAGAGRAPGEDGRPSPGVRAGAPPGVRCDEPIAQDVAPDGTAGVLACGGWVLGGTAGGIGRFDEAFYRDADCAGIRRHGGNERIYRLDVPSDQRAVVSLDSPCGALDLVALRSEQFPTSADAVEACEAGSGSGGGRSVELWGEDAATWYVVVQGHAAEEHNFSLSVACEAIAWADRPATPPVLDAPRTTEVIRASAGAVGHVRYESEGHAETPTFSADGQYIAFELNHYGEDQVETFYARLAGVFAKDAVRIRLGPSQSGPEISVNAVWHPAQPILLFERTVEASTRLYLMSPGGPAPSEMVTQRAVGGRLMFPTLSRDGMQLAFVSDATGNGDIYLRNSRTGVIDRRTTSEAVEVWPSWRRDGRELAFVREVGDNEDILAVPTRTGSERVVAGGPGDQTRPVYAADDRVVYFTNERIAPNRWDIRVADPSGVVTLATDVRLPTRARPGVSPDGRWVAWTSADPGAGDVVRISSVDGGSVVEVPVMGVSAGDPAFGASSAPGGGVLLAYTYLPQAGADWRRLAILDVTDALAAAAR